jgi:hypothetical protein
MFSPELKKEISEKIQQILRETNHPELPEGEIPFILHVDGGYGSSWANIRNTGNRHLPAPEILVQNMSMVDQAVKTYLEKQDAMD